MFEMTQFSTVDALVVSAQSSAQPASVVAAPASTKLTE